MNDSLRVMVVDDDKLGRTMTLQHLLDDGYVAETAENAYRALQRLETGQWDVVVSDMRMPNMDGLELLRTVKKRFPEVDFILITAYGSVETAVTAIKGGAADYLTKPFRYHELAFRLQKLAEMRSARKEIDALRAVLQSAPPYCDLVGHSPPMKSVHEKILAFADNSVPVLITGETGTGKELVCRALHRLGSRAKGPLIAVACGSIPRDLAESELFGHEKGAFTNAIQRRIGSFERAGAGTILLDDVDDLHLEIQAKLLRVLQEGTIIRVGGGTEIAMDARVVATTKRDLKDLVAEGRFRDDLFYRLRGLEIRLPTLRERGDDVLILAHHFLQLLAARDKTSSKRLSIEAAGILKRHDWPGNVRELSRAMESALVICDVPEIGLKHLPQFLFPKEMEDGGSDLFKLFLDGRDTVFFNDQVERFEHTLIQWALHKTGGQKAEAAKILSIPRTTFLSKFGQKKKQ